MTVGETALWQILLSAVTQPPSPVAIRKRQTAAKAVAGRGAAAGSALISRSRAEPRTAAPARRQCSAARAAPALPLRPQPRSGRALRALRVPSGGAARPLPARRWRGEAMPAAGSEGDEGPAGERAGPGAPKLCGYLQKLSGKGPLRGFRSRWFVFDPRRCYLYYFKGPQEALPLGHIDIASACFGYHQPEAAAAAAAGDEAAAFEVRGPGGAVAVLKVGRAGRPRAGTAALGGAGAPGSARNGSEPRLPAPHGASRAAFGRWFPG